MNSLTYSARHMIYMHIYNAREVSSREIASALDMSRPTLTKYLSAMEKKGLISRTNTLFQEGRGRKPFKWSVNSQYRTAIGVEILKHSAGMTAVDLYGRQLGYITFPAEYENDERYYRFISAKVEEFLESLGLSDAGSKILGIGFAIQGLVSDDGKTVIYGEILKCTGLTIDVFTRYLDYPCRFIHEPDGAALSELWVSPELKGALYLSMSEHLGGAVISNRILLNGRHRHAATFEHITANPGGELCYCGKRGCYETICSRTALLGDDDPDEFFGRVRNGEPEASRRWGVFLKHLGRLIAHLHLVVDTEFILGGHLAPYFRDEDIRVLYDYVRELTPFEEGDDYILVSKMPEHNITIGAALPYVISFLENIGG